MNKEARSMALAGLVGQVILLGVIVLQNRSMKKNNAEAAAAVARASMIVDIMENCTGSCVDVLNDPVLTDEERRVLMAEQFSFVQIAIEEDPTKKETMHE